uniref:cytochrome c oxidase subunit III n=1 Tax=Piagetiella africana TaxID=2965260 RepID=UPI00286BC790|nr:cytochrome c oxidase subunit III [Piagetiella africana]WKF19587.1 cytochrome c oxidase subunit 3 [Piagetiella africana]
MKTSFFSFHVVSPSPWPLYMSCSSFCLLSTILLSINLVPYFILNLVLSLTFFFLTFYGWMRDVCYEGFLEGEHTMDVQKGLKMGMVMFITSEVMFFFSFFWSIFYYSLSPSSEIYSWPPVGLMMVNPLEMPLLITLVLLSSGISITWSHHSMLENNKTSASFSLFFTIFLGLGFSVLQVKEYIDCSFTIADSVFGSIFYLSTGFHGFHMILGTSMLIVCYLRMTLNHFSKIHHVGYEASVWYWHFVDVVWLFLYICMYWWSS